MAMDPEKPLPDNPGLPDAEDYEGLLDDYSHFAPPPRVKYCRDASSR